MIKLTFKDKDLLVDESYVLNNNLNKWKNWKCSVGNYYIRIANNGDVKWGNCAHSIYVGNIISEDIDIQPTNKFLTCNQEFCHCFAGLSLDKYSTDDSYFRSVTSKKAHDLNLYWMIDSKCNFDCWYCAPHLHSINLTKSLDNITLVKDRVLKILKKHSTFLNLAGGEPTLFNDLPDWCEEFEQGGKNKIFCTTNGSRSLSYLTRLSKHCEISFSVHTHQNKLEKLIDKINKLSYQNTKPIQVQIPCAPNEFKNLKKIIDQIEKNRFSIRVQKLFFENGTTMPYSNKQDELINKINDSFTF